MRRLNVAIVDLVTGRPTRALYSRLMNANLASIMPQAIAVWCSEAGHNVRYICYTGTEDIAAEAGSDVDLVFVGGFTRSAQLAYALSRHFRSKGAATVLGGPHARCYSDDAALYFDYVLGFTDRRIVDQVLEDCAPHRPIGRCLSAARQPHALPSVRERWPYVSATLAKAPDALRIVPMISSLGCPYTCSFCIDSTVKYQPLSRDALADDLRFLEREMPNAVIGWHDPNFGVRFDEYLTVIEEASAQRRLRFVAESSLSLLSESNVKRMAAAGFRALLPGIESWYGMGFKSKTGAKEGMAKVEQVSDHVNMLLEHVEYVQTNFVLGLDQDEGEEPFELTKRFIDRTPGAFPAYSQRTAFGESVPENLELQRDGRVLGFPFHFLDNNQVMNVVPRHYGWDEFYRNLQGLTEHSFSRGALWRRWRATKGVTSRWLNLARSISSEGFGRIAHYKTVRRAIAEDPAMRLYLERESDALPDFYRRKLLADLGPYAALLPEGAIEHDAYAYLHKSESAAAVADAPVPMPAAVAV